MAAGRLLAGMDCDDTRFGRLLCARLGYSQLEATQWHGTETGGLTRQVNLVVKCEGQIAPTRTVRVLA
eukprot:6171995-Pleurochrysis_carterae.AAC.1